MRGIIGEALPHADVANATVTMYADAQREAARMLEAECQRCRGCPLGRE